MRTKWRRLSDQLFNSDLYVAWGNQLRSALQSLAALPSMPPVLWIVGVWLIAIVASVRIMLYRRMFARAESAPTDVQRMVQECAATFSLRRTPDILMVRDRVSPMIWCGMSPRLILPSGLWDELDDAGKRAVIHHELAHLKRRDHWLRWAELIVGCVYWWHPMVWWVRRKLRDEADHCCDAWVTAILPSNRRAYASALVQTKAFLNNPHSTPGPIGLGVTTATAKRFARRLTMVMTHRSNPRLSVAGLLLAATLAALTAMATPIWACPTDRSRATEIERGMRAAAPSAFEQPRAQDPAESTYEHFIKSQQGEAGPNDLDARMSRLEERLQRAMQSVERLLLSPDAPPPAPPSPSPFSYAPSPTSSLLYSVTNNDEELVDKSYKLPKDQLDALTKLMSRSDVPILVRPGDDEISVRATRRQHLIFGAFVSILNPEQSTQSYTLSQGILQDLADLVALDSVPLAVQLQNNSMTVKGSSVEQRIFAAFSQMIDPDGFSNNNDSPKSGSKERTESSFTPPSQAVAPVIRSGIEAEMHAAVSKAKLLMIEADRLEKIGDEIEANMDLTRAEMEAHEDDAEQVADEAEEMLERAEDLVEEAEETEQTSARYHMIAEAGAIKAQASARRATASAIQAQADAVRRQIDVMESQAEAMRERAEALREQAQKIEESIGSQVESLESSLSKQYDQLRQQFTHQADSIQQLIQQYQNRMDQEVNTRLETQLRQRLSVIDRAAEQRVIRSASAK